MRIGPWLESTMRFAFADDTEDVAGTAEFNAVRRAFDTWAAYVPIEFREVGLDEDPHVRISWIPLDDRPGGEPGVIAYSAFPPQLTGQSSPLPFKFIDQFNWHIDGRADAHDIETTALHEIGHLLGLAHSEDPQAVMYFSAGAGQLKRALSQDDREGIRGLYTQIVRRGDSANAAGAISAVAAVRTRPRQIVTAVRNGSDRLLLISWRVEGDGAVTRTGDSGTNGIKLIRASSDPDRHIVDVALGARLVTACRNAAGDLELRSWTINASGAIGRTAGAVGRAGSARHVKIVALSPTLFVTACRNGAGRLLLMSWRLEPNGSLVRLSDSGSAAGAVSEIALSPFGPIGTAHLLLSAVRDGRGRLLIISWRVTAAGTFERRADTHGAAGKAKMIRVARESSGRLMTAMRANDGSALMIVWSVADDGRSIERLFGSTHQGEIEDLSLMSRPDGRAVTAVRNASNDLQMIPWTIEPVGYPHRAASPPQPTGEASMITLLSEPLADDAPIATVMRTGRGRLKIITWDD